MAISKESLEQLIEQCEVVYCVNQFKNIIEIKLDKNYYINTWNGNDVNPILEKVWGEYYSENDGCYVDDTDFVAYIKNLFETKSEAEHYARFGNMFRTETLSLPSWESLEPEKFIERTKGKNEFDEKIVEQMQFNDDLHTLALYSDEANNLSIELGSDKGDFFNRFEFSKTGYTEACELVRKLWMGEK